MQAGIDVAVTFAFESDLPINWTVDAYIWYLPDGSRVNLCVAAPDVVTSNPPSSSIGRSISAGGVHYSEASKTRLQNLRDDHVLMAEIQSRINFVEGRCD
jgi:hypothetical protein